MYHFKISFICLLKRILVKLLNAFVETKKKLYQTLNLICQFIKMIADSVGWKNIVLIDNSQSSMRQQSL